MEQSRALSPFSRWFIIGLRTAGYTYPNIEEAFQQSCKKECQRTIQDICKQWEDIPKLWQKKDIKGEQFTETYQSQMTSKIANPQNVSGQTLVNFLKENQIIQKSRPQTFFISLENKDKRVNWCKHMLISSVRELRNAIYSDKS